MLERSSLPRPLDQPQKWKKGRHLGSGTYGEVVEIISKGKHYAVKKFADTGMAPSPMREAACMIRLHHPNVLEILQVGLYKGHFHMVLPLAQETLRERLERTNIDWTSRKRLALDLLRGVEYCLSKNVLHRDLKPENLLIFHEEGGEILKIADFGLARALGCVEGTGLSPDLVTVWYRSPEILLGGFYHASADKWAVGCILYELFREDSQILFRGKDFSDRAQMERIHSRLGPLPREVFGMMPRWDRSLEEISTLPLDRIVTHTGPMTCMVQSLVDYDPNKRPPLYSLIRYLQEEFGVAIREVDVPTVSDCLENVEVRAFPMAHVDRGKLNLSSFEGAQEWLAMNRHHKPATYYYALYLFYHWFSQNPKKLGVIDSLTVAYACNEVAVYYLGDNLEVLESVGSGGVELTKKIWEGLSYDLVIATCYDLYQELHLFYPVLKTGELFLRCQTFMYLDLSPKQMALLALYAACQHEKVAFKHPFDLEKPYKKMLKEFEGPYAKRYEAIWSRREN